MSPLLLNIQAVTPTPKMYRMSPLLLNIQAITPTPQMYRLSSLLPKYTGCHLYSHVLYTVKHFIFASLNFREITISPIWALIARTYQYRGAVGNFLNFENQTIIREVMIIWICPCILPPRENVVFYSTYVCLYIIAAQSGLTEGELEDLLSLSDDVLNDVYQWWTPPIRRLPPLLWVRVKNELEEYIVERYTQILGFI